MSSVVVAPARSRAPRTEERRDRAVRRARSALSSRVYLPAFSIVAVTVILLAVGWATGWGGAHFAAFASSQLVIVAGPLTLAIIGVFLVIERLWPAQPRPLVARGNRQDLLYTVLNATVLVPLVAGLSLAFGTVVRSAAPWIMLPPIATVPRWGIVAALVVIFDGCNWFVHLAVHRILVLWRFHELHHSQEDLSVLTVFRTHPLLHVPYLVTIIPGIALLASGTMSTTVLVLYGAFVAFAHSNTRLGFGPLERVFVSPNYHRIHHQLDGPQDVNLGFVLTIWDQLFGRAVFPTEATIRADTGLPGRPLVVEHSSPRARHLSVFAAQLVAPFRPMHHLTDRPPVRSGARRAGRVQRCAVMVTTTVPAHRSRVRGFLAALLSPRTAALPADCALVAVRVVLAWIFVYHGSRRLFGWFDGPGLHASGQYFANTAHLHPGEFFALMGGMIEFFGGIAIALGLLARLAGAGIFVDMMMAIVTVTWANGINATTGKSGYELNLALGFLALVIAFFGAGRFSIDALLARRLAAGGAGPARLSAGASSGEGCITHRTPQRASIVCRISS